MDYVRFADKMGEHDMILKSSKQLQALDTERRLKRIHEWHKSNPDATVQEAVTFIPETEKMVLKYRSRINRKFPPRLYIDVLGEDFED